MKKILQNWLEIPEKKEINYDQIRAMVEYAVKEAFLDKDEQCWQGINNKSLRGLLSAKIQQIDDIVERIKKKQL